MVADMDNDRVQKLSPAGRFLTALRAGFDRPTDVAVAPDGTVYEDPRVGGPAGRADPHGEQRRAHPRRGGQ
jgi:streptogramin lyase